MKGKVMLLIIMLVLIQAQAGAPDIEWSRTFGGGRADAPSSIHQTTDGGYIILGTTISYGAGDYDIWLIKTDSKGNEQWNRTFGGSDVEISSFMEETSDGGYIIAGGTRSYGAGGYDIWLIKTDSKGNEQWNKTFGGEKDDMGNWVHQTSDGGYIIAGITNSFSDEEETIVIKTDQKGEKIWERIVRLEEPWVIEIPEVGKKVLREENSSIIIGGACATRDGGVVISGWNDEPQGALIKLNSRGETEWSKRLYGWYETYFVFGVVETRDGGYAVTGSTVRDHLQILLTKTDSKGNREWLSVLAERENSKGFGFSVQQTRDGGYIVTGYVESLSEKTNIFGDVEYVPEDRDLIVVKTDSMGNEQWTLIPQSKEESKGVSVLQTGDGGYIVAGILRSTPESDKIWLIKLKPE